MIISTRNSHAIKTQLYRWYNGYEKYFTASRIANQLELISEDIVMVTPRGTTIGKTSYMASLAEFKGIKISHKIEAINIESKENGISLATVNIIYHGIQKDGTDTCLKFIYENELYQTQGQLPVLKKIKLSVDGALKSPIFHESYPTLRSLALMHYYLFLLEQLNHNSNKIQEILADNFQLNLSEKIIINSIDALDNWLKSMPQQITSISHYPKNTIVNILAIDKYELNVDFDWEGWTKTGQKITAKTHHNWTIIDKKNAPFAKIQSINVIPLAPFKTA